MIPQTLAAVYLAVGAENAHDAPKRRAEGKQTGTPTSCGLMGRNQDAGGAALAAWPADEDAFWRSEMELVEAEISRREESARAILQSVGCSTDLVTIYDFLDDPKKAPWARRRTAARDRRRALHAMHTLALLSQVRGHIAPGEENARLAAYK